MGRPREGSSFVTGDAVNVGARLEQAAAPGEILVGERTARPCEVLLSSTSRGRSRRRESRTASSAGVWSAPSRSCVHAVSAGSPRFRRPGERNSSSFGRVTETQSNSEPRLVTIMGDAGVGKTRLVRELWAWLAEQEPQPLQRTGRCLPTDRASRTGRSPRC